VQCKTIKITAKALGRGGAAVCRCRVRPHDAADVLLAIEHVEIIVRPLAAGAGLRISRTGFCEYFATQHDPINKIAVIWLTQFYEMHAMQSANQKSQKNWEEFMDPKKPAYFDLETVALLRETLDDAWECLRPQERATMSRTQLAEGILALAAEGERNPDRLLDAALMAVGNLSKAHAAA